jgi:hypothetical protein
MAGAVTRAHPRNLARRPHPTLLLGDTARVLEPDGSVREAKAPPFRDDDGTPLHGVTLGDIADFYLYLGPVSTLTLLPRHANAAWAGNARRAFPRLILSSSQSAAVRAMHGTPGTAESAAHTGFEMELAGLEPATSWVRSTRSFECEPAFVQRFSGERLGCRNSSRNLSASDLQSHRCLCRQRARRR